MKIKFPKARTIDDIGCGDLFTCELCGKTYNLMKTELIIESGLKFNCVDVKNGKHFWVDHDDGIVPLDGYYVVEGYKK